MASQSNIQALLDARSKTYGAAFERLDLDGFLSWHSEETRFNDIAFDEYAMTRTTMHTFFSKMFPLIGQMRILESQTTGSVTHCTWETLVEVEYKHADPTLGLEAGRKTLLRIASVMEWRWGGEGEVLDGTLGEEAVRGWKVVKETDYTMVLKTGSEGEGVRLFGH